MADGLGHFYKLFSDGKAYKLNSPSTMLVICQTGIRLHKYDLNQTESFPKLQFEYDWNGIASFEIQVNHIIMLYFSKSITLFSLIRHSF